MELQDPNASQPPLPARAANKGKAAVLVTSLPPVPSTRPVLCWLCPEVGGRVDADHPRRCVHGRVGNGFADLVCWRRPVVPVLSRDV